MTLPISNDYYHLRWNILRRVYDYKLFLLAAYQAQSPQRVAKAKAGLIRYLYRLIDSPELGPPPKFSWPPGLEAVISFGLDASLDPAILNLTAYSEVAEQLERSLHANSL